MLFTTVFPFFCSELLRKILIPLDLSNGCAFSSFQELPSPVKSASKIFDSVKRNQWALLWLGSRKHKFTSLEVLLSSSIRTLLYSERSTPLKFQPYSPPLTH